MNCPCCGGTDIYRSRRRGLPEKVKSWFGAWPYRCLGCRERFFGTTRKVPAVAATPATGSNPEIAFRTHTEKPVAQVVVRADSHEQLDAMLLAMGRAISSFNGGSARKTDGERVHR